MNLMRNRSLFLSLAYRYLRGGTNISKKLNGKMLALKPKKIHHPYSMVMLNEMSNIVY